LIGTALPPIETLELSPPVPLRSASSRSRNRAIDISPPEAFDLRVSNVGGAGCSRFEARCCGDHLVRTGDLPQLRKAPIFDGRDPAGSGRVPV